MRFENQVAIITGASRGIGLSIAKRLAGEGAKIAAISRSQSSSDQAATAIGGDRAKGYAVDVADRKAVSAICETILADLGRVDVLVNNAGLTRDGLAMRMSEEDWDAVINTNLKGAFNFIQGVMRGMIRQRSGRIVNISSVSGLTGNAGQANYAASKAGLLGLSKSLARELASRNITVNVVAPGFITTDMTDVLPEQTKAAVLGGIPLGKFGEPEDIAAAVAFLASPEAKYITGQVLTVDGGMVM
ncbi:MAG: 3-oxoacyl-[acyl-carrier protein] reductase [Chthoniobacter sp.]|jgi:3-oxoacyl-[acyl-carrier protein] reductase|nr:3-oxoacyl-[acyl-carrier protein] reductase [Chthoniobacter sp.]